MILGPMTRDIFRLSFALELDYTPKPIFLLFPFQTNVYVDEFTKEICLGLQIHRTYYILGVII